MEWALLEARHQLLRTRQGPVRGAASSVALRQAAGPPRPAGSPLGTSAAHQTEPGPPMAVGVSALQARPAGGTGGMCFLVPLGPEPVQHSRGQGTGLRNQEQFTWKDSKGCPRHQTPASTNITGGLISVPVIDKTNRPKASKDIGDARISSSSLGLTNSPIAGDAQHERVLPHGAQEPGRQV